MANLSDLKAFGESVVPIVQQLAADWAANKANPDKAAASAAVAQLKTLVSQSSQPTPASIGQRAAALAAMDTALTEILVEAASNQISLPETKVRLLQAQENALTNAFGLLQERAAFDPIATLLQPAEINQISQNLDQAAQGIQQKQTAKDVLDTVIDVAIIAVSSLQKLRLPDYESSPVSIDSGRKPPQGPHVHSVSMP